MLGLSLFSATAQPGGRAGGMGGPPAPQIDKAMAKLFGDNTAFSADMETQFQNKGESMNIPVKMAYDSGKSRSDIDMSDFKGGQFSPDMAARMKQMGMDKVCTISLPDQKIIYLVYPGLQAYTQMPIPNQDGTKNVSDFKVETTELGKETINDHPCVKNKVVVTDDKGVNHEFLVWNATDMNKFPVKFEMNERGQALTMYFKNVKLTKPDASQFEPPSDYKKYDSQAALMQQEMMKRMGGMGMPPR